MSELGAIAKKTRKEKDRPRGPTLVKKHKGGGFTDVPRSVYKREGGFLLNGTFCCVLFNMY